MSRQGHLPPRCPFQSKGSPSSRVLDSDSFIGHRRTELRTHNIRHRKSPSQGAFFDEQPSWLDELLNDSETNSRGIFHRRSASDSIAFLDVPSSFPRLTCLVDKENPILNEDPSSKTLQCASPVPRQAEETRDPGGLEAGCVYGPNSPRGRSSLNSSKCLIVSALAECAPPSSLSDVAGSLSQSSEIGHSDAKTESCAAISDMDSETKAAKRHSGQRSRVRKLQYIAELERTVNVLKTLESDLTAKVGSLFQKRVILSVENNTLKQQIASLREAKTIKDGHYQSLKNEADRLNIICMKIENSQSSSYFSTGPTETAPDETSWQMLDMGKLSLGGNPVPSKHGFRS